MITRPGHHLHRKPPSLSPLVRRCEGAVRAERVTNRKARLSLRNAPNLALPRCPSLPLTGSEASKARSRGGRPKAGRVGDCCRRNELGERDGPRTSKTPHTARSEGLGKAARTETSWFSLSAAGADLARTSSTLLRLAIELSSR